MKRIFSCSFVYFKQLRASAPLNSQSCNEETAALPVSPERHSDTEAGKMVKVGGVEPTFESQGGAFVHPHVDPAANVVSVKSSVTEEQAVARSHERLEFAVDRTRQKVIGEIS